MKFSLIFTVILLIATSAQADTGFLDRSVVISGETHRYQVYVPAEFTSERKWPVIVALHADGSQGSDGLLQTARGLAEQIRQRRAEFPAIVVFPQARVATRFMAPVAMQDLVITQVDRTVAEFNGDVGRIYLVGYSMGGGSVYRIAYRWPERFAALVVIAGPVVPEPGKAPAAMVELDRRTNTFAAAPDPFAALAEGIAKVPIRIYHGDADETPRVDQARRLVAALVKVGATYRYIELPGANHADSAQAYADSEMITWLLMQHR